MQVCIVGLMLSHLGLIAPPLPNHILCNSACICICISGRLLLLTNPNVQLDNNLYYNIILLHQFHFTFFKGGGGVEELVLFDRLISLSVKCR